MTYENYKKSRNTTWKTLLEHRVNALPVQITKICSAKGIEVYPYKAVEDALETLHIRQRAKAADGFALAIDNRRIILYNQECGSQRCRFTIAHELGHFELGHVMQPCGSHAVISGPNREPCRTDNPQEHAANVYASRLLAPACVLWGINAKTTQGIAAVCDISMQAARFRRIRMEELYQRERICLANGQKGCFLLSEIEREVYNQFLPYIEKHRL